MSSFFERVRAALAEKGYQVQLELGSGGMGMVVLARDTRLDRLVAVKVIRPEMHTAATQLRFVEEARMLARFKHRNIVTVYEADEVRGLPYYAMEYLEGEAVADLLRTGPLPRKQVLNLGRGLLDALGHAHSLGVVHRDVKPTNVFWDGQTAVLADFGIAKRVPAQGEESHESRTEPGVHWGTREYMAPEQLAGAEASPVTDLYAAALVIYEAYTGRHWLDAQHTKARVWRRVPWLVQRILRRALAWQAEDRWPHAVTFRLKLWHTRVVQYQLRALGLTMAGLVAGAVVANRAATERWPFYRAGGVQLVVTPFEDLCTAAGHVGDRVARRLVRDLQGYVDFSATGPARPPWLMKRSTVLVQGSVCTRGDSIRAEVDVTTRGGAPAPDPAIVAHGDTVRLDMVADTLAYGIVHEIWNRENALDPYLPIKALPRNAAALAQLRVAEQLVAQARWGEADEAYDAAEAIDSTCWLCPWRHAEVDRWLGRPFDRARADRYRRHIDVFPSHYQELIRASEQPLVQSLATLKQVVQQRPRFLPALFRLADETYHRGPLIGRPLRDAIEAFETVVRVRPDFLPASEHLAWALTAYGNEAGARAAFQRLEQSGPPRDPFSQQVRALLSVALVCRFEGSVACGRALDVALGQVDVSQYPDLAAGPRYLMTFDAPGGAVQFGQRFATREDAPALVRSGLVAELSGFLSLGLVDSARAAARALRGLGRPELTVLPAELDGALLLLDPPERDAPAQWTEIAHGLVAHAGSRVSTAATRRRAAWMLILLGRRWGALPDSETYKRLLHGEPGRRPLARLLEADALARAGRPAAALQVTDSLTPLQADSLGDPEVVDPFFRTVLHLFRADWSGRGDDTDGEERELHWYENNDVVGRPSGPPQVGDIDWGFGTLARWRLAQLHDATSDRRACALYLRVVDTWGHGDPRYHARAATAAARVTALQCSGRAVP
ncbi:MAG TPA: serine/threonine-protein kinase [Gemmatimonadales bacterium]|nr:serine/threonine-protein kinase [Gemmatimonadales bacterium]